MIAWLAAVTVLAIALTWALRREHERIEREARIAALLEPIRIDFERLQAQIGEALLPAFARLAQAAPDMEPAMKRLAEALRSDGAGDEGGP